MVSFPGSKINIGLHVLNKRDDGFHNIETLFCPVSLCDILEIIEMPGRDNEICEFKVTGSLKDTVAEDNLVYKAHKLISSLYKIPAVGIHLHKIIPAGAGLGGGSSNAAFCLKMLNEMFSLGISTRELINLASQLGSDCAFFIENKAVMAYERGNVFSEAPQLPADLFVVIIHPGIHVNTAAAYSGIIPAEGRTSLRELVNLPLAEWKENIVNDFENTIFKKYPAIAEIKAKLYEYGAVYASMSGSGSAVYGLFTAKPVLSGYLRGYFRWQGSMPQTL